MSQLHAAYSLEGTQGMPVLVLANSLAATPAMWDAQMPAWRQHFQVLRYSYRGHGNSRPLDGADSVEALAGDLLGLLDQLGIGQFTFVGLSLGGLVGLCLAATTPDRVSRLVAANFRPFQAEAARQQWDQRMALVRDGGVAAIVDGTADRWLTANFRASHPDVDAGIRKMIGSTSRQGYLAAANAVKNFDARPLASRVRCPVLLLSGSQDLAAPEAEIAELGMAIPSSTHVSLMAAHLANVECSDEFAKLVQHFALSAESPSTQAPQPH
jgi:3-oxoadipate enol-lactonase